ncbi:hypothetical protein DZK25_00440 [Wenzhouxiangella sp. 15181]|nr:hypothetical protein DZK25_00440 [Wenzhouxiangella sp. 15181]RFP68291.1 hypothetical protein DZK26_08615 [Wenzhouxiangella sp. 15190]
MTVSRQIVSDDQTVRAGELIEYVTDLQFSGGETREFSLVEVIREPLHIDGTVELSVRSGAVSSRRVAVEKRRTTDGVNETVVRWRGTMAAGGTRIQLTIPVRVEVACRPGQTLADRRSQAVIAVLDGSGQRTTASSDYSVQCPPMVSLDDIAVDLSLSFPGEEDGAGTEPTRVSDSHDRYANVALLQATLSNQGQLPATVGVLMDVRSADSEPPGTESRYAPVLIDAGETRTVAVWTDMRPHLDESSTSRQATALEAGIHYVLLSMLRAGEESVRPGPDDEIRHVSRTVRVRGWDLGDAPDSSNRAGVAMNAYRDMQAGFASVFDTPPSAVPGPAHARPRPLHLGRSVSREADADLGTNANIEPARNRADLDEFDDGTQPASWALRHCRATTIDVQVFVSREAAAWFAAGQQSAFLNAWLDFDRDGQWGRVASCPSGRAFEHAVIDYPVDVAALGPGYHTLQVPTGRIHWPSELALQPAWVRLSLSETPSVKTAAVGSVEFGDGRGSGVPWRFGETEDFLLRPLGSAGAGPDLAVDLGGSSRILTEPDSTRVTDQKIEWTWVMDYANIGSQRADNVERIFDFPHGISRDQIEAGSTFALVKPRRDAQTIYSSLQPDEYSIEENRVRFEPVNLAPGERGRLVVQFRPEIGDEVIVGDNLRAEPVDWTVHAEAITQGDINTDNHVTSFSEVSGLGMLTEWPEHGRIAARSPNSPFWVPRGTTNQSELTLGGFIPTGETAQYVSEEGDYYQEQIANEGYVNLWIQVIASTTDDSRAGDYIAPGVYVEETSLLDDGRWQLDLTNLPDAHYRIAVGDPYACDDSAARLADDQQDRIGERARRDGTAMAACGVFTVDSSLPIDPISLGFVEVPADQAATIMADDDGRPLIPGPVILPDTLGFSRGDWSVRLPASAEGNEYIAVFGLKPSLIDADPRLIDRYGEQQRRFNAVETAVPAFYQTESFFFDEADALFGKQTTAGQSRSETDTPDERELIVKLTLGDMDIGFAGRPAVARHGQVWKAPAGVETGGLSNESAPEIRIDLLVGVPLRGEMLFVPWNGEPYGQTGSMYVQSSLEGAYPFSFSVPRGVYQLVAQADGYQMHRSPPFIAEGPIERGLVLQPISSNAPDRVIMIEDQGMSPAWSEVRPGGTVRLVNLSSRALVLGVEESDEALSWRSGQLQLGESLDLVAGEDGLFTVTNSADPLTMVELQVAEPGDSIFRDGFEN